METVIQATALAGFRGAPFSQPAIDAAVDAIRTECEWHIAPVLETTTTLYAAGGNTLVLPSLRVASITRMTGATVFGDVQLLDHTRVQILDHGIILLGGYFPDYVTITFRHGFAQWPDALKGIVAERALSGSQGRIKSEALAGRSIALEGGYDPASDAILSRYRLGWTP